MSGDDKNLTGRLPDRAHSFGFTGQMESTISRFYAGMKLAKAAKYALILSSASRVSPPESKPSINACSLCSAQRMPASLR